MNQASEIKNREQKKLEAPSINQSINQSSKLYLVKDENLKKFLYKNPDLKRDVEEMHK